ncbi:MAG TPA: hypothetical protein VHM24_05005, partial [Gemmatimonadaceae bacterium]|nr:hypothetical protein [Gemmatimonadaceae bacterium]
FVENVFLEKRADFSLLGKIPLPARVATLTAHMDQVRERLCTSGALVEICPLSSKGIGRYHGLGVKAVSANGATKLDLTQRRHGFPLYGTLLPTEGIFVP